jgi:HSP20 family protein
LISDYAGGEIDSLLKDQFEAHLQRCPRCRVMVRTMRQTILLCRRLDPVQMPPEVHKKLRITIKERWQRRRLSSRAPAPKHKGKKTRDLSTMAAMRYPALTEWARMDEALNRLFRRHFLRSFLRRVGRVRPREVVWSPVVDLLDRGDHLLLRADLPGIRREEVKVSIIGGITLTIRGEATRSSEERGEDYCRCERYSGGFTRTVRLPTEVVAENAEATLQDGILEVMLPKKDVKKSVDRRIELA